MGFRFMSSKVAVDNDSSSSTSTNSIARKITSLVKMKTVRRLFSISLPFNLFSGGEDKHDDENTTEEGERERGDDENNSNTAEDDSLNYVTTGDWFAVR